MANAAAKMFVAQLESENLNYKLLGDDQDCVFASWKLDNTRIEIYFYFGEDNEDVHIEGREFLKVPENKYEAMYKACSQMNRKYRWIKFDVNEKDGEIVAECDAVIQLDSCAAEVFELMIRTTNIVDDVYPEFMKAMWS